MKQPEAAEAGRLPAKAQGMTLMEQPEAAEAGRIPPKTAGERSEKKVKKVLKKGEIPPKGA
jgi:hypothetical protein